MFFCIFSSVTSYAGQEVKQLTVKYHSTIDAISIGIDVVSVFHSFNNNKNTPQSDPVTLSIHDYKEIPYLPLDEENAIKNDPNIIVANHTHTLPLKQWECLSNENNVAIALKALEANKSIKVAFIAYDSTATYDNQPQNVTRLKLGWDKNYGIVSKLKNAIKKSNQQQQIIAVSNFEHLIKPMISTQAKPETIISQDKSSSTILSLKTIGIIATLSAISFLLIYLNSSTKTINFFSYHRI
jgi:hypothetical protein